MKKDEHDEVGMMNTGEMILQTIPMIRFKKNPTPKTACVIYGNLLKPDNGILRRIFKPDH